jgi:hypothetical protein
MTHWRLLVSRRINVPRIKFPKPTSAIETTVDALAVARLVRLIQHDDIWPIMETRQAYLAKVKGSRFGDLATCPWCLGFWMGTLVVVLRIRFPRGWSWIARVLAGSEVAGHMASLSE